MSSQRQLLPIDDENFRKAQKFLKILGNELTVIRMAPDKGKSPVQKNGHFANDTEILIPELIKPALKKEIIRLNSNGYYLWFLPNQSDGNTENGTGARNENITHLTSCFVDTDAGDPAALDKFCRNNKVPYQLKVQSSPGKYHIYFLLEKIENTPHNRLIWEAIQRKLMSVHKRFDHSTAKPCQYLRLPFFYHNKADPFLIEATKGLDRDRRYTLAELYELTGAHTFFKETTKYELPTETIPVNSRHADMVSYVNSESNDTQDPEKLITRAIGHAIQYYEKPKDYTPGGFRFKDVPRFVENALEYRRREKVQLAKEEIEKKMEALEARPFELPDEFYFNCPNGIGEIVREISEAAEYPCPAVDFAGILSLIGLLKSHRYKTSLGHAPVNYFVCLVGSGGGKNHIQNVVDDVAFRLQLHGSVQKDFSSDKGIMKYIQSGGNKMLAFIDEIEILLSSVTNDKVKAESYQKRVKPLLLRLYSATNRTEKSAPTANPKDTQIEVLRPHLNICLFGTPSVIKKGFSSSSISDGLLARFLFVLSDRDRQINPRAIPGYRLSDKHYKFLAGILAKGNLHWEEEQEKIAEIKIKLEESDSPKEKKALEEELRGLQSTENIKAKIIPFSKEAKIRYMEIRQEFDNKSNAEKKKGTGLEFLYNRAGEQIGRLCAVISFDQVKVAEVEYCAKFVLSRVEAMINLVGADGMNLSDGVANTYEERTYDALLQFLRRKCTAKNDYIIAQRDLHRGFKRPASIMLNVLKSAVLRGAIIEVKIKNKRGPETIGYQLTGEDL